LSTFISPRKKIKTPAYTDNVELIGPKVPYCPQEDCIECLNLRGIREEQEDDFVEDCSRRIENADVVVGWINKERDCYGTIMELGMELLPSGPSITTRHHHFRQLLKNHWPA